MKLKTFSLIVFGLFIFSLSVVQVNAQEFRYRVEQGRLMRDRNGELIFSREGVEFLAEKSENSRKWAYNDIKLIEIPSPRHVHIWTYDDERLFLGKDEKLTFKVIEPELDKVTIAFLRGRVNRPFVVSFSVADEGVQPIVEIAVKHLHRLGGCQGVLKIYKEQLTFVSSKDGNSRTWYWTDLQSVGRTGPYRIELSTYERETGGSERNFNFELKEPLPEDVYDMVWSKVYSRTPSFRSEDTLFAKPEREDQ
jgi:hypothetical protein